MSGTTSEPTGKAEAFRMLKRLGISQVSLAYDLSKSKLAVLGTFKRKVLLYLK